MRRLRGLARVVVAVAGAALLAPIAIALAPFWLVARATRVLGRLLEPRTLAREDVVAADPDLGWRARPHLAGLGAAAEPFALTTDGRGLRDREATLEDADTIVLGGSLAWGEGVPDAALVSRHVGSRRTKALAAPGHSSVQAVRLLAAHAPTLAGKSVVWLLPIDDDPFESGAASSGIRAPFLRGIPGTTRWEIVTRGAGETTRGAPPASLERVAALCCEGSYADRTRRAWSHLVAEARDVCLRSGARLVVVGVPHPAQLDAAGRAELRAAAPAAGTFDSTLPERSLAETCRKLGVPFATARGTLARTDFAADAQLGPEGHAQLGALVADTLTTGRPRPAPRPLRALVLLPGGGQAA